MPSFFCERTAEYLLVPRMRSLLMARFTSVVPMFYWKSREGSATAIEREPNRSVRVLAMFARRPKIAIDRRIAVRINRELFEFAQASTSLGIPAIGASPVVSRLSDLYRDPVVLWLSLHTETRQDLEFMVDPAEGLQNTLESVPVLSDEDVLELVCRDTRVLGWAQAMEILGDLRSHCSPSSSFSRFFGFGGYKPVYFLIDA